MTKKQLLIALILSVALSLPAYAGSNRYNVPIPTRKNLSAAVEKSLAGKGNNLSADDLAQVEAAAKKVSLESQQMEKQANQVKQELETVNKKMIKAAREIQAGEDEVARQQAELEKLQQHLDASEEKFNAEHNMLVDTLASLQSLALRPSKAVLIQPLSPVEVMRSSLLLRGSVKVFQERAESIRQSIEDISNQKAEIAKRLDTLAQKNKALAKQQDEMALLSKQKSVMYNQLSAQSKEAKQKAQQLAGQARDVRDLLNKLEKQRQQELKKRQLAEKERLAKERALDKVRAENQYKEQTTAAKTTGFAKAKGRLARPARGAVVTNFHQELSKGVTSNGIDIKTAAKAQVIAPFDGTVIFAGPFKNFATLVILDHGDGYTSLLSGLNETYTEVGQMLLAGEPVGVMPSGGNAKLHMEIRKNNQPLNPNEWMSTK